jgi:hypothetical protein
VINYEQLSQNPSEHFTTFHFVFMNRPTFSWNDLRYAFSELCLLKIPQLGRHLQKETYVNKINFPLYAHNLDFILFLLVVIPWRHLTWLLHWHITLNATKHHTIPVLWSQCMITSEMYIIINFWTLSIVLFRI